MSEIRPQAGSEDHLDRNAGHEESADSAQAAPTSVEPVQPQDTQAAGATGATQKDLLQKNVSGSEQKGAAERAKELQDHEGTGLNAGVHSTGSATKTSGGQ
ncbi:MAG TPA: hypothetical protein VGD62_05840 [Acidobacteriaceae bacterium]